MLTIERSLNIYAAGIPQIISLSQYDDDFQLVFTLYTSEGEFTIPSGTTAEVMGTKVDGNGYSASASISGSTVTVTGNKQMTACAGRNVYEIVLTKSGKRLATVNFILKVERAALDADTIQSETVLKELNAIIDSAETSTQAAAEAAASAAAAAESARTLTIDPTLTQSGQAADAKVVGDEISGLKEDLSHISGLSDDIKDALLACFEKVAWIDEHGQTYYDNLYDVLYPQPVPEWDYEWYATSQTIPTDMTGVSEYDFTTEPGAIYILRSDAILNFNYIGDCEIEIEAKFNDYLAGSVMPQITLRMANAQTEGRYIGGVIAANKTSNNPYINYNIDGNWVATTYDQRQYHVYNIKAKNGTISVTIDGTLVATGSGREYSSQIITGYNQPKYEPAFLKSIKFKRL